MYLNDFVLPQKIKDALISSLRSSTGKRVAIDSAKLDIFRGLIIKGLVISDDKSEILSAKDISCRFLAIPVFKKEIVVTAIRLNSSHILLERFPDNSVNIVELFFKKPISLMDGRFTLTISRIITHGDITFKDDIFGEPFVKDMKNANVDIRFNLPGNIRFNTDFEIPSQISMFVKSNGKYSITKKELSVNIEAKDFVPKEFINYCDEKKFRIPDGRIDASVTLDYKDNMINIDTDVSGVDMKFSEGKIDAALNGMIKAKIKYNLLSKELIYTGQAVVKNLSLYNLNTLGNIYDIRGNISFSDKVFNFNDITATVSGLPVKAKAEITDIQNPVLKIGMTSVTELSILKNILKDKFNIDVPLEMNGRGSMSLMLLYKSLSGEQPVLTGSIYINKAILKSEYSNVPLEEVIGRLDFTQNQLAWKDLKFKHNGIAYKISGIVTNFQKPGVQIELDSQQFYAKTLFFVSDKSILLSSLSGRFRDYEFSIQGDIDIADPKYLKADLNGLLAFELSANKEPYKNFKDKFKYLKLSGDIKASFKLKGTLNNIRQSMIDAEIKCDRLSVNNVRLNNFVSAFAYRNDISNIKYIQASFCGGTMEGNGLIDFSSNDTAYQFNADVKGVKIEELKKDTVFKDKDISGVIQARIGVKGISSDFSKFNAWGKISISKGKLWQLNLFHGIGTILFRKDFGSVLFEEGNCDFSVKDKSFFTNNLVMKSSLINLYGAVKISFDKTIAASLRTEFTDDGIDAARASDLAGAIERYSVIEVKGTLDEPEYKVRPDLSNVMGDIADNFFNQ